MSEKILEKHGVETIRGVCIANKKRRWQVKPEIHFDLNGKKNVYKKINRNSNGRGQGRGKTQKQTLSFVNRFYEINNLHRFYLMPVCKSTKYFYSTFAH